MILELLDIEIRGEDSKYRTYYAMLGHMKIEFLYDKVTGKLSLLGKNTFGLGVVLLMANIEASDLFFSALSEMERGESRNISICKKLEKKLRDKWFESFVSNKILDAKVELNALQKKTS